MHSHPSSSSSSTIHPSQQSPLQVLAHIWQAIRRSFRGTRFRNRHPSSRCLVLNPKPVHSWDRSCVDLFSSRSHNSSSCSSDFRHPFHATSASRLSSCLPRHAKIPSRVSARHSRTRPVSLPRHRSSTRTSHRTWHGPDIRLRYQVCRPGCGIFHQSMYIIALLPPF